MTVATTRDLSRFLVTTTRENGVEYISTADDCPDWLTDAIYAAHDDEMPNDWRYEIVAAILACWDGKDSFDACSYVQAYTLDLLDWVSRSGRSALVDELANQRWRDHLPPLSFDEQLMAAQEWAIWQMYEVIQDAIDTQASDEDEDEDA